MHQVDFPRQAFLQKNERTGDVRPKRLLFMGLAPVDVRTAGFAGAIDDDVGLLLLKNSDDRLPVGDVYSRSHGIRVRHEKLLAEIACRTEEEDFHGNMIEETEVTEVTEETDDASVECSLQSGQ